MGDGANIAARIEALVKPEGISGSDDAYRQVRDRSDVDWADGGEHEVSVRDVLDAAKARLQTHMVEEISAVPVSHLDGYRTVY